MNVVTLRYAWLVPRWAFRPVNYLGVEPGAGRHPGLLSLSLLSVQADMSTWRKLGE